MVDMLMAASRGGDAFQSMDDMRVAGQLEMEYTHKQGINSTPLTLESSRMKEGMGPFFLCCGAWYCWGALA